MITRVLFVSMLAITVGCAVNTAKEEVIAPELNELGSADSVAAFNQGDLAIGTRIEGDLTRRHSYHYYSFTVDQEATYLIDLASREGADTYLLLYRQTESGGWDVVERNDDCYSGTLNSCVNGELERGTYAALVSTYQYMSRRRRTPANYHLIISCTDCVECPAPDAPGVNYTGDSPEMCARIRYFCEAGFTSFSNECGCGCIEEAPVCIVAGCSSQLCVAPGESGITTCEWREEYACYQRLGECGVQADGACGWTPTDELNVCLEDATALDDCRSSGCGEGSYCSLCWSNFACIPDGAVC